jgi:hypothetical protein
MKCSVIRFWRPYDLLTSGGDVTWGMISCVNGRSLTYKLQCTSVPRTRETDFCMGEGLLSQRS